ncbi:MAG: radical SAM protein [Polyangiaceae bacterium]
MARVLVVFPPLRVSVDFVDYPYFADLGALSAAGSLRASGHEVYVIDALARPGSGVRPDGDGEVRLGVDLDDEALSVPSDVVVVAYTPFHRPPAREPVLGDLLSRLRRAAPDTPLVLADAYQSGQHYVDAPGAEVLASYPEVDVLLRFEAERSLPALVERLARHGRPPATEVTPGTEPEDLDALASPAWDLVDVESYYRFQRELVAALGRPSWAFPIEEPSLPMLTSRGCPYRCIHCSSNPGLAPGAPKRQRRLSRAAVARELERLAALGAKRVHVLDELANVSARHFDGLLAELEARGLGCEIPNGLRMDHLEDSHLARLRGRLTTLSVSAESGVQRVVDEIVDKELDLAHLERIAERAKDLGLPLLVHFIIGLPGESREEINQTLEVALSLHERYGVTPSVQFATPLPGTRLAARSRELPVVSDWGPRFQRVPSPTHAEVTPRELGEFKQTFDFRLSAMQGPKKVIMNVTYRCNNRCTFCAVGTRSQVDGNFERQKQLLDKYRALGVRLLDLDGGEPTLYDKLFSLVRHARAIGYEKINVTTNGRMAFYPDYARRLARSGVSSILFSLHGPTRHLHAANVGVPEAFDQTLAGIENVRRAAPRELELGANVTLTLTNHRQLGELTKLVFELGLRWLNIQFLTPFGRATNTVAPDTAEAARVVMQVIDAWHDRMKLQVVNLPWCFLPGYESYLSGDLLKLERHMLFVNNEEVNLFEYLRQQRTYEAQCAGCSRKVFCGGFYRLDDVPEPEWLISPEDLVRPVSMTVPTASRS